MTTSGGSDERSEVDSFLTAWFAVRQLIQSANFNHFHQAGLSATQFMVLNVLPHQGQHLTMGDLAKRLNLKAATIAKTVDSLESRQLVKRARSETDGRVVLVKTTRKGQELQNAAAGKFRQQITVAFRSIGAPERAALINGLESFVAALVATTTNG